MNIGVNAMDNVSPVTINTKYTIVSGKEIKKYKILRYVYGLAPRLRVLDWGCDSAGICMESRAPIGIVYNLSFISIVLPLTFFN